MKLEYYLQLVTLIILVILIWQDNRREKRRETAKDRNLASSFNNLKDCLADGLQSTLATLKTEMGVNYQSLSSSLITLVGQPYSKILREIEAAGNILVDQASVINLLSSFPSQIDAQFRDINSQLSNLNSQILGMKTPWHLLCEAQTANYVKDGEANRTLRKRLQEKNEFIADMHSKLKAAREETAQVKAAAQSYLAQLVSEVDYITAWIESKGMPLAPLTKALDIEFKGQIPSREYHKAKNQKDLQNTIIPEDPKPSAIPAGTEARQHAINA